MLPRLILALALPLIVQAESDVAAGRGRYRVFCASCHGMKGLGGRGPDLVSGRWTHGSSDADLHRVIEKGVPEGGMPAFPGFDEKDIRELIAFLRSLAGAGGGARPTGNPARGRELYWGKAGCPQCHMIQGRGGRQGPDLTRIGAQRSLAHLRESLVKPSADLPDNWRAVRAAPRGGRPITGFRVNEDNFTIQIFDASEKYYSLQKDQLERLEELPDSLMPAANLAAAELDDLIAYLDTLRGKP